MPKLAPQAIVLKAHLEGAPAHEIGDEIWHEPLDEAIRYEAEATVEHIPARLLVLIGFDHAVDLVVREMTARTAPGWGSDHKSAKSNAKR